MDTENTTPEPSLEESIGLLLSKVPAPVRDFVLNELQTKTQELMFKYNLHVDQGGLLERELLLMLLGQEQPTEFVTTLQEAGISAQTVQSLVTDINTDIFMKLHEQEAGTSSTPSPVVLPVTPTAPAWPLQPQTASAPAPSPVASTAAPQPITPTTPPAMTPSPYAESVPAMPRPAAVIPPAPAYMPPPPPPEPVPPPAPMPAPSISQFAPQPLFPSAPTSVASGTPNGFPAQSAASISAPAPIAPVTPPTISVSQIPVPDAPMMHTMAQDMTAAQNVPAAALSVAASVPTSSPVPPQTPAPSSANRDALHAVLKEYGVDPYREPPE